MSLKILTSQISCFIILHSVFVYIVQSGLGYALKMPLDSISDRAFLKCLGVATYIAMYITDAHNVIHFAYMYFYILHMLAT